MSYVRITTPTGTTLAHDAIDLDANSYLIFTPETWRERTLASRRLRHAIETGRIVVTEITLDEMTPAERERAAKADKASAVSSTP